MQTIDDITATIRLLFLEQLAIEIPSHDADLIETGVIDSLSLVDLLVHLEKEFGLSVVMDELDADDFRSLDSIAAYVKRCVD